MAGREDEYAAVMGQPSDTGSRGGATGTRGGAPSPPMAPPPIDQERRGRSPGIQNNFYEVSQADFKKPYGAAPGTASPPSEAPPAAVSDLGGDQPFDVRRVGRAATDGYGAESLTPAAPAIGGRLQARVAPIVGAAVTLVGVAAALSARKEAAEGRAREETLSRRLAVLEAQLESQRK